MSQAAATPTESTDNALRAAAGKYLTFRLGKESYGLAVLKVREIIRMQNITVVPQMPEYVKGVINLRGKVIPVIDLRQKFGLDSHETTELTCIVVVQIRISTGEDRHMGLIVDAVEEVLNISKAEIEETPDFGSKLSVDYIYGMAKVKGAVKTLLDIDKVVADAALEDMVRQA